MLSYKLNAAVFYISPLLELEWDSLKPSWMLIFLFGKNNMMARAGVGQRLTMEYIIRALCLPLKTISYLRINNTP